MKAFAQCDLCGLDMRMHREDVASCRPAIDALRAWTERYGAALSYVEAVTRGYSGIAEAANAIARTALGTEKAS